MTKVALKFKTFGHAYPILLVPNRLTSESSAAADASAAGSSLQHFDTLTIVQSPNLFKGKEYDCERQPSNDNPQGEEGSVRLGWLLRV